MYQRKEGYWTAIGVAGSALTTLNLQAAGMMQASMDGRHAAEVLVTIATAYLFNVMVVMVWWWRHAFELTDSRLRRVYSERHLYYPWGSLVWWYFASLGCGFAASLAFQVPVAVLLQLGMPLGIMTVLSRAPSLWLTGWHVRHRRLLIPAMGVIQFLAVTMAASFLLLGGPIGLTLNWRMIDNPIILLGVVGSILVALTRVIDRKVFREERRLFLQRTGKTHTEEEDAAFLTGKLMFHMSLACLGLSCTGLTFIGLSWGIPRVHDVLGFAIALAIQCAGSIGNVMTVASSVHGHLGLYGLATASMVGLSYLWDWLFRSVPVTTSQVVGATIAVACLGVAMWFQRPERG